jgi:LysM repeat protein
MNNSYHIDVTPEEDSWFQDQPEKIKKEEKNTFIKSMIKNKIFWCVVGVHLAILSVLATASPSNKETSDIMVGVEEDKNFIKEEIPDPKKAAKEIVETLAENKPLPSPAPIVEQDRSVPKKETHLNPSNKFVKEYTIKTGDTLYSVSKKYKLNYNKLIKINNIKDPNKITVGQKLKFL